MYSIPNLVANFAEFLWVEKHHDVVHFEELDFFSNTEIVLHILIDGLWFDFLKRKWWFLYANCVGHMNSTFPSSTSVAMTAYYTWKYPWEIWFFWWNQLLPLWKRVIQPLPYEHINLNWECWELEEMYSKLIPFRKWTEEVVKMIIPQSYFKSYYTQKISTDCIQIWYNSLDERLECTYVESTIRLNHMKKNYILSYRPWFDDICHKYWHFSLQVENYFDNLSLRLEQLIKDIKVFHKDNNSFIKVVISSDHWHMQSSDDEIINIDSMIESMSLISPISWESRFFYLNTKLPSKSVKKVLDDFIWKKSYTLLTLIDAIKSNLFWPKFDMNFSNRVWWYIVILNDLFQVISGNQPKYIWNHGWLSSSEIKIPIILL